MGGHHRQKYKKLKEKKQKWFSDGLPNEISGKI